MSKQIIKTKSDALYAIAKKEYKTRDEMNEAWLRWFIYGDIEKRTPCNIYETFMNGDSYQDTFPAAFAKQLIEHLVTCPICGKAYSEDHKSEEDLHV